MPDYVPTQSAGPPHPESGYTPSRWGPMIERMVASPAVWFEATCPNSSHSTNIVRQVWRKHRLRAEAHYRKGVMYARVCPDQEEQP